MPFGWAVSSRATSKTSPGVMFARSPLASVQYKAAPSPSLRNTRHSQFRALRYAHSRVCWCSRKSLFPISRIPSNYCKSPPTVANPFFRTFSPTRSAGPRDKFISKRRALPPTVSSPDASGHPHRPAASRSEFYSTDVTDQNNFAKGALHSGTVAHLSSVASKRLITTQYVISPPEC
jgi:hypothetical protein